MTRDSNALMHLSHIKPQSIEVKRHTTCPRVHYMRLLARYGKMENRVGLRDP